MTTDATDRSGLAEQGDAEPAEEQFLAAWANTTKLEQEDSDGTRERTVLRGLE